MDEHSNDYIRGIRRGREVERLTNKSSIAFASILGGIFGLLLGIIIGIIGSALI